MSFSLDPPPPLLRIARTPPLAVGSRQSVREAVDLMAAHNVGAVVVVEGERLVGIFTERDVMTKVVARGRDPATTPVADVMVRDPVSVADRTARSAALDLMITRHFRHLPVTDDQGRVLGMLSLRHLLRHQFERLKDEMDSLEAYVGADGPGG